MMKHLGIRLIAAAIIMAGFAGSAGTAAAYGSLTNYNYYSYPQAASPCFIPYNYPYDGTITCGVPGSRAGYRIPPVTPSVWTEPAPFYPVPSQHVAGYRFPSPFDNTIVSPASPPYGSSLNAGWACDRGYGGPYGAPPCGAVQE